jgi:hypothetical protein
MNLFFALSLLLSFLVQPVARSELRNGNNVLLLTHRVDLDLAHRKTLSRRQDHEEISSICSAVKGVAVRGQRFLGRRRSEALRVANCVVRKAAAAHPDLEACKASQANFTAIRRRSTPHLSPAYRSGVAKVNHPPWSHSISRLAYSSSSFSVRVACRKRPIVGQ